MMLKKYLIIIGLGVILFTADAFSQRRDNVEEGNIGLGPQIGYQRAGDADAGRFMFGAVLRAKLSYALGVEGSINYREEKYHDGQVTVRTWPVMLSALFYPFPQFYALAGGGWHHSTFDFDPGFQHADLADKTVNPFGWHVGGGAEVPLGETVRLFGDVRYVFLDYDFEDFAEIPLESLNSNFYIINVGIIFGFR
jgi:hypothetical protein